MTFRKTLILCIVLGSIFSSLKASYYESDFFPIGLTGINYTGDWNCPYENKGLGWTWDRGDRQEKALIEELGVNCIGCEDAQGLTKKIFSLHFNKLNWRSS